MSPARSGQPGAAHPRATPPAPISYEEALQRLQAAAGTHRAAGSEPVALQHADGRVLAAAQHAPHAVPPFANSAMDGFVLHAADLGIAAAQGLPITASQLAGASAPHALERGACARIATGAAVPAGADTVVPQEAVEVTGEHMRVRDTARPGAWVRQAGSDVEQGTVLAAAGEPLTPAALALMSAAGVASVPVRPRPGVALLLGGDELRPPGAPLLPGQIHDSNTAMLSQLLAREGVAASATLLLPDEESAIESALLAACAEHALVIACGGASVGQRDFLPRLAARHGTVHFWRVRIKPGMPVLCASVADALLLVLPGNPVSAFCSFHAFVRPALDALQHRSAPRPRLRARVTDGFDKPHQRHELLRAHLRCTLDGVLLVTLHPAQESHQLSGVAACNALVHVPAACSRLAPGDMVDVEPYATWGVA